MIKCITETAPSGIMENLELIRNLALWTCGLDFGLEDWDLNLGL